MVRCTPALMLCASAIMGFICQARSSPSRMPAAVSKKKGIPAPQLPRHCNSKFYHCISALLHLDHTRLPLTSLQPLFHPQCCALARFVGDWRSPLIPFNPFQSPWIEI
jgi:hypothetical protein